VSSGTTLSREYAAYEAGVMPCGWDGVYPAGRLAVFLPSEDDGADER
jgi:hypothetical protein